jgi:hypothetical protein
MSIANRVTVTAGAEVEPAGTITFTIQAQTLNRRNTGRQAVLQVFVTDAAGVVISSEFNVSDGGAGQVLETSASATRFVTDDTGLLQVMLQDANDIDIDAILNIVLPNGTVVQSPLVSFAAPAIIPDLYGVIATGAAGDMQFEGQLFDDIDTVEMYDDGAVLIGTFPRGLVVGADPSSAFRITDVLLEDVTVDQIVFKNADDDTLYAEAGWALYVPDEPVIDYVYDDGFDILEIRADSGDSLEEITHVSYGAGVTTGQLTQANFTSQVGDVIVVENATAAFGLDPDTVDTITVRRLTDYFMVDVGTWTL